ncbi:unnamed protein product [Urochloa humidicola]
MAFQGHDVPPYGTKGVEGVLTRLDLAVVAMPLEVIGVPPTGNEVLRAIEGLCGAACLPTCIERSEPDYILYFDTPATRDLVNNLGVLRMTTATYALAIWTPYFRNQSIPWETKVMIIVSRIPPNACDPDILPPVLAPYCHIRASTFNKITGTCVIEALTSTVGAIPTYGTIAYRERTPTCTILRTCPVWIEACVAKIPSEEIPYHPLFKAFCDEYPQYHWTLLYTAFEFGVDPDVLYEHYVDTQRAEDLLNGLVREDDDSRSSSGSWDYDGYSCRMMDDYSPSDDLSDREPAEWRGRCM